MRWSAGRSSAAFDRTVIDYEREAYRSTGTLTKCTQEILAAINAPRFLSLLNLPLFLLDETTCYSLDGCLRFLHYIVSLTRLYHGIRKTTDTKKHITHQKPIKDRQIHDSQLPHATSLLRHCDFEHLLVRQEELIRLIVDCIELIIKSWCRIVILMGEMNDA